MKTVVKILAVLLVISCGKPGTEDIKKQIDTKKAEIAKLQQEISDLDKKLSSSPDTSNIKDDAHLVSVQQIEYKPFMHYIEVQGTLDGDDNVAVYPEAMGVIEEISGKVGQHVTKGQVLARMNDAAVKEQLKGIQTSLDLATTVYEKQKSLWDQNIGSEVQYLQAKNTKETLEAQLAGVKRQLDMMCIKAPINGTIEECTIKLGQTASPQLPSFRVVNFGQLKVITDVAEAYASKIKPGDEITVFLPDIKKEYKARVSFASNYINQVNRTFRVEASLSESDNNMKANMVAVIKIIDYKNDNAVVVPVNFVQKDQNGDFIYIAKSEGNKLLASKKNIQVGQIYNGLAEISTGITQGDKIITNGYLDVEEGEHVRL